MKWDFAIGNPPYQGESKEGIRKPPVYNTFMDAAYDVATTVELITPARFLFNAGQTPKAWNEKMLNDEHFQVLEYEPDASKVFANTEIKGGIAVTMHDTKKRYGAIKSFSNYAEMNGIVNKIKKIAGTVPFFDSIVSSKGFYKFSEKAFLDFPKINEVNGDGTGSQIVSKAIEMLPEIFSSSKRNSNDIEIFARINNQRAYRYLKKEYVQLNPASLISMEKYNVACSDGNGRGVFGETLSETVILPPMTISANTYISIGAFESDSEAQAVQKYIKTKFLRSLLSLKKVTQHNPKSVWCMIPLQDFSIMSDIDWSTSIANIDKQLYKKYGLSQEEIDFIENNVKEME